MSFGKKLLEQRKINNLSAQELAIACDISRSYITLIENGMRMPAPKMLSRIAEALHLQTHTVLNWYLEEMKLKVQHELTEASQASHR